MLRLALVAILVASAIPSPAAERPNVLMICIDDLNDWVGCLGGNADTTTPNIDRLAERSRLFTNAHCAVTVCSPSRISVLSGLMPSTHGSYELGPAYEEIPALDEAPTILGWFREHGYRTMAGGKVLHHGFRGRLAEDVEIDLGKKRGGPKPKEPMNWEKGAWDWGAFPPSDEEMYDYQLAGAAAEALGKDYDRPFFLSVGFFRPHVPMYASPRWFDDFPEDLVLLPNDPIGDLSDVPKDFQSGLGIAPRLSEIRGRQKWKSLVQAYLANTAFVDHCVGRVIDALDDSPHKETTLVVLWSDHGFHLGEKNHIAKRTLWEESTRIPFLIGGADIAPGPCDEPVSLVDLFPTLTERCGIPAPKKLDGESLAPQLRDPTSPRERPALSASYHGNWSVRDRHWRYIRYASGTEELYDHRVDPDERTNLAHDPEQESRIGSMARWIPADAAPEFKAISERKH